jgi:heavy metal translocating P-type ATPase
MKAPQAVSPPANCMALVIAALALAGIATHLAWHYLWPDAGTAVTILGRAIAPSQWPLVAVLVLGGAPLVIDLSAKLVRLEFASDLLAGISIVTSAWLGEYLAGVFVVLMLSGGEALEAYAVRSASSVLAALARRMPQVAHRKRDGQMEDVSLDDIRVGDTLVIFPHEISPVDGTVVEGRGSMDEAYLTGEPYVMSKVPGSQVLSGAINGASALTIRADRLPVDSRYERIMQIMRQSERRRPRLRRLADQLGAWYLPAAVAIAAAAGWATGDARRFLAVLVVATPCPLIIAIPVAIIGAISLAARKGIIIKDPSVLERIGQCRTAIFDKTGTLTYGQPRVTAIAPAPGVDQRELLLLLASVERYSKHPLAGAVLAAGEEQGLVLREATEVHEEPGRGLTGLVSGHRVHVTSRKKLLAEHPQAAPLLPERAGGLECVVLVDDRYAGLVQFRDQPRREGALFVGHLGRKHLFQRVMLVSGDRESEVRYLAEQVGIDEVYAGQSPEEKFALVRKETQRAPTLFVGDGINDAPALTAATVGVAFGGASDITAEAAGAVVMDRSLERVDELLHIGRRLRTIALQSAVGGMAASIAGMLLAAMGYLPPVAGAIAQEVIDVMAVVNALRVALPPKSLTDYT